MGSPFCYMVSAYTYISAIDDCYGLFKTLEGIRPCRDERGQLQFVVGSSSVIFKMNYKGELYKLRCYLKQKQHLSDIYRDSFFKEELRLGQSLGYEERVDVVLEKWIEGRDLGREILDTDSIDRFQLLSQKFDCLALKLLKEEWAHGDLKPSNIIVTNDNLVLIDFDNVYHPSFSDGTTTEWGSLGYQHPNRKSLHSKAIDHYPIALISTVLHALSYDPSLLRYYSTEEMLLINPSAALVDADEALCRIKDIFARHGDKTRLKIAELLHSQSVCLPELEDLLEKGTDL